MEIVRLEVRRKAAEQEALAKGLEREEEELKLRMQREEHKAKFKAKQEEEYAALQRSLDETKQLVPGCASWESYQQRLKLSLCVINITARIRKNVYKRLHSFIFKRKSVL